MHTAQMPDLYVLIYNLVDDYFKQSGHREPRNTKLSDAEIVLVFLAACIDYGANVQKAQKRLFEFGVIKGTLDKGQLNRRIHGLRDAIWTVNQVLAELKKKQPGHRALPPTLYLSQCAATLESLGANS